jgi:Tfp pilus assembly protein PilV
MTRNRFRSAGFSFTEVLFAVMILGIGFIMVAAIFPVAIVQTKLTQEETAGTSIARGAANYVEQISTSAAMPATGMGTDEYRETRLPNGTIVRTRVQNDGAQVWALDSQAVFRGSQAVGADARLAWVPFYSREGTRASTTEADWQPYAKLYMIPVAVRARSAYDTGVPRVIQGAGGTPVMVANIVDETNGGNTDRVDYIEFPAGITGNDTEDNYTAVSEGSYVIVAATPLPAPGDLPGDPLGVRARVGHIFRIGSPTDEQPVAGAYPRRWNLTPGYDYVPKPVDSDQDGDIDITPTAMNGLSVFVVGRGLRDPSLAWNATSNVREGTGQEVGAYVTFVQIR